MKRSVSRRAIGGLDVAASLVARLAPRAFLPAINRARLDVRSLIDGLRGVREPSFSTPSRPPRAPAPLSEIDPLRELLPIRLQQRYSALIGASDPGSTSSARRSTSTAVLPAREVRVNSIRPETDDAVTVEIAPIDGAAIQFIAGQFLTVEIDIDGAIHRRAYSISSAPHDAKLTFTCKRISGGKVSTFVCERLRVGDRLLIRGPSGNFLASPGREHRVFIAGGSGITPCASIIRDVLENEARSRVTLIYGNRSRSDIVFRDAIDALAKEHRGRLVVRHLISAKLDRQEFEAIATELERDAPEYFVCGPEPMMRSIRDVLENVLAVPRDRIREERFFAPIVRTTAPRGSALITIRRAGEDRTIAVGAASTVLEAAIGQGVALPYSCAIGGCAACRCRLVEGEVDMDEPNCLDVHDRARGLILTCVARPRGNAIIEVPQ